MPRRAAPPQYIPSYLELRDHPKVEALSELLGVTSNECLGILHRLWWHVATYNQDGDVTALDEKGICRVCRHRSRNGQPLLRSALIETGWLDEVDGQVTVHDWEHYGGKSVAVLLNARERMSRARAAVAPKRTPSQSVPDLVDAPIVREQSVIVREQYANSSRIVRDKSKSRLDQTLEVVMPTTADAGAGALVVHGEVVVDDTEQRRRSIWSAFDTAFGKARTSSERGRRAKAVSDLVSAGIDAEMVSIAVENWPRVMHNATCTETGIAAHIGRLTEGWQVRSGGVDSQGRRSNVELLALWMPDTDEVSSHARPVQGTRRTSTSRLPNSSG